MSKNTIQSMLSISTLLLLLDVSNAQDCNGCSSESIGCHTFDALNNKVFACKCSFTSGMTNGEICCADGYHMCKSGQELYNYGLTKQMCNGIIPSNEVYWSLESNPQSVWNCNSKYGTNGINDIWGCAGNRNSFPGCNDASNCFELNIACHIGSDGTNTGNPWSFPGANGGNEYSKMNILDSSRTGALCCQDPTQSPSASPTQLPTVTNSCDNECDDEIESCLEKTGNEICNNCEKDNKYCLEFDYSLTSVHNIHELGGCNKCKNGYFMKNKFYPCVNCQETINGCLQCADYQGCVQCDTNNFEYYWDNKCKIGRCKRISYLA